MEIRQILPDLPFHICCTDPVQKELNPACCLVELQLQHFNNLTIPTPANIQQRALLVERSL